MLLYLGAATMVGRLCRAQPGGPLPFVRRSLLVLAVLIAAGCGAKQLAPLHGPPLTAQAAADQADRAVAAENWSEVLTLSERVAAPVPTHLEFVAIRALWELHRDAEAKAAEAKLLLHIKEASPRDALNLAVFHRSTRRQAAAAWLWLAALTRNGCDQAPESNELCRQAALTLGALDRTAEWTESVLAAAPHDPKKHLYWMRFLTSLAAKWGNPQTLLPCLLADAVRNPTEAQGWWLAYGVARTVAGDEARQAWRTAIQTSATPTATLLQVATQVAWQEDRQSTSELLRTATARGDSPDAPGLLAAALARQDDSGGLQKLASESVEQFTTPLAKLALVRSLLSARLGNVASPLLNQWATPNAEWLALRAEAARQSGNQDAARALVAAIDTAPGDRSLGWLIVGETWKRSSPGEALHAIEKASETEGRGQRAAAALRTLWLVAGHPTAAATTAVRAYARQLEARTPSASPGGAAALVLPSLEDSRRELLAWLGGPEWQDLAQAVVQGFAVAGVAQPEQLREVAVQAAQRDDLDGFLAIDAAARAAADERFAQLPTKPLLMQLIRRGAWLARWLHESGVRDFDDGQLLWSSVTVLFDSEFAVQARQLLHQALGRTAAGEYEPPLALLQTLATAGGASALVGEVARRRALLAGKPGDAALDTLEVSALLATGQATQAVATLNRAAARTDLPPRALRPLLDLAARYGLCASIRVLAPRLASESDLYSLRAGLEHGLTCARRLGDTELARSLIKVAYGQRLDASRLDSTARALVQAGFYALALDVYPQLAQLQPLTDESLLDWAKALLATGMPEQAADLLRHAQTPGRQVARLWRQAWNLFENFGQPILAVEFAKKTLAYDPDTASLRSRLVAMLLRLDQRAAAASELANLAEAGMDERDAVTILTFARRARAQRPLLDVLAPLTDPDRDTAWLRGELAADLGDRAAVQATVQQFRAKHTTEPPEAVLWLERVGLLHDARQSAVDQLASSEPLGLHRDRSQLLTAAVELRHDPGSEQDLLGLVRIYLSRAARSDTAALETAALLEALGWPRHADAIAKTLESGQPPHLATAIAHFAWQAGRQQAAVVAWERIRAQLTVDPELREILHNAQLSSIGELRNRAPFFALMRTWAYLERAGQYPLLLAWIAELLQLAPESEFLHAQQLQWLVQVGRLAEAKRALATARQRLPHWSEDMAATANLLAREAGAASLSSSLQPSSEPVRTSAWWLALLLTVGEAPPPVEREVQRLLASQPELRLELAIRQAAIGKGPEAIATLGELPLACALDQLPRTAVAMAAALVSVQGQAPAGTLQPLAQTTLLRWLDTGYGSDGAVRLAFELSRQGHPELAALALQRAPTTNLAGQTDGLERRLLALLGHASDSDVVDAALAFVKGNRSVYNLGDAADRPGELLLATARSFADDVINVLVVAGRNTAAAALAQVLRESEPNIGIAAGIESTAPAPLVERAQAWQPAALTEILEHPELATTAEQLGLLPQFAAHNPQHAWQAVARLAKTTEEPWRLWLGLARALLATHDLDYARRALAEAHAAGAPAAALACPASALGETGAAKQCWREQHLVEMDPADLGDLAAPLAADPSGTLALAMAADATASSAAGFAHVVAALAERALDMGEAARRALGSWLALVVGGMRTEVRRLATLTAMEDLGQFGLGDLGIAAARAMFDAHPSGHSSHNDYAYSLYLAGRSNSEALQHARVAEWSTDGEAAMASLDTLAAIVDREGQTAAAIAIQRRSLAAGAAEWLRSTNPRRPRTARPPMALPLARYAEFLVKQGQLREAQQVAAQGLRLAEADEEREEPSAVGRLRRILRITLRATAPAKVAQ